LGPQVSGDVVVSNQEHQVGITLGPEGEGEGLAFDQATQDCERPQSAALPEKRKKAG